MPVSHPTIAAARMIQTSDWCVEPSTRLTSTFARVADDECDQHDKQRDEEERPPPRDAAHGDAAIG